jgi:hypothetical protein
MLHALLARLQNTTLKLSIVHRGMCTGALPHVSCLSVLRLTSCAKEFVHVSNVMGFLKAGAVDVIPLLASIA